MSSPLSHHWCTTNGMTTMMATPPPSPPVAASQRSHGNHSSTICNDRWASHPVLRQRWQSLWHWFRRNQCQWHWFSVHLLPTVKHIFFIWNWTIALRIYPWPLKLLYPMFCCILCSVVSYVLCYEFQISDAVVTVSVWRSGPRTDEGPRTRPDQTDLGPDRSPGPAQDHTASILVLTFWAGIKDWSWTSLDRSFWHIWGGIILTVK